jgi:hypothetical protein
VKRAWSLPNRSENDVSIKAAEKTLYRVIINVSKNTFPESDRWFEDGSLFIQEKLVKFHQSVLDSIITI